MQRLTIAILFFLFLSGCTAHTQPIAEKPISQEQTSQTAWSVSCVNDKVTGNRKCYAGTFGRRIGANGMPYGQSNIPYQVYFNVLRGESSGPRMFVGYNTYPGKTPTVKIDNNEPLKCTKENAAAIIQQMKAGDVVTARFYAWPDGPEDIQINLSGFPQAWQELKQVMQ